LTLLPNENICDKNQKRKKEKEKQKALISSHFLGEGISSMGS